MSYGSVFCSGTYRRVGVFNPDGSLAAAAGTVAVTPLGGSTVTKELDSTGLYGTLVNLSSERVTVVETIAGDPGGVRTTVHIKAGRDSIDTSRDV